MADSLVARGITRASAADPTHFSTQPRDLADRLLVAIWDYFGPPSTAPLEDILCDPEFDALDSVYGRHAPEVKRLHKHNPWHMVWGAAWALALFDWCDARGEILVADGTTFTVIPKAPNTHAQHPIPFPWETNPGEEPPGISPVERAADIIEVCGYPLNTPAEALEMLNRASDWANAAATVPWIDAAMWRELALLLEGAAMFAANDLNLESDLGPEEEPAPADE